MAEMVINETPKKKLSDTAPVKQTSIKKPVQMKNKPAESQLKPKTVKPQVKPKSPKAEKPKPKVSDQQVPAKLYLRDQFFKELTMFESMNARTAIGLDIDADKVRYLIVKKARDEVKVLKWGVQKFPSEERDRKKAMQIALENIKAKVYKRGMLVNVSVFSPEISTRHVIFPEMKKESDLKQAIYHKNEQDLQNFNEKSIWNYEVIDEFESEGIKKYKISVAVAPDEIIGEYIQVFSAVGIQINHLIPRPSAIQSGYRKMIFRPGRDLLIDIGYNLTQMCFIKNGHIEYIRNVSIGSRNLEVTIHNKGADTQKKSAGSKNSEHELSAQKPEEVRGRLLSRIKDLKDKQNPVLHTFFSEILRSLSFFQGKDIQQYIERIFVTGYGIRKESLLPYLKSRINIPVFILTPQFEERPSRTTEFGEYFSTLGTTIQDSTSIDILPDYYKTKYMFKRFNFGLTLIMIVLFVALGFISVGQYNLINHKNDLIVASNKEYEKLNPIEGKYQEIQNLINDVNQKNNELVGYIQSRPPIIEVLRLLSNEVPQNIRLENIEFVKINVDPKNEFHNDYKFQLDLEGTVTSDPLMADVTLINFVNHLLELKYFKHVNVLNKLKDTELEVTKFGLRLYI